MFAGCLRRALWALWFIPILATGSPVPGDWFQASDWRAPILSFDGRSVAALTDVAGTTELWAMPVEAPDRARRLGPEHPVARVVDAVWSGPEQVVLMAMNDSGGGGFWTASLSDEPARPLTPPAGSAFVRLLHPQPQVAGVVWIEGIAVGHSPRRPRGRWLDLLAVDTATGSVLRTMENPGDVVEWRVDDLGRPRLALAVRGLRQEVRIPGASSRGNPWRVAESVDVVRDAVFLSGMASDGSIAWIGAHLGRDTIGVHTFDLTAGRFTRTVIADDQFDIDGPLMVSGGGAVSQTWQRLRPHTVWFDPRWGGVVRRAQSDDLSTFWSPVGITRDGRRSIFEVSSDLRPSRFAILDRDEPATIRWLPVRQSRAVPAVFGRVPVEFAARDGQSLTAYVTRPSEGGRTPLLVLVHGGPWARDVWGWLPEVQFLASRGWTVLQVNYRGSAGFGRRFQEMPAGDWRGLPTTDLVDGAQWAVDQGFADSSSTVIAGTSFGGHLALLGLARAGETFRAGASLGGVFDLGGWLRESCRTVPPYVCAIERWNLGGPHALSAWKPGLLLNGIRSSLMVLHSDDDAAVPVSQSIDLADAARVVGAPVVLQRLPRGGHSLGSLQEQAMAWATVSEFLSGAVGFQAAGDPGR